MDNDDLPVGRVLSRRETIRLLAAAGAAALVGCERRTSGAGDSAVASTGAAAAAAVPDCVVRPELTVGPYFVDRQLDRSDIRNEPATGAARAGVPLALAFTVKQIANGACTPLANAMVDVWHCDARGIYSGVSDERFGFHTVGQKFLRGYQVTDSNGIARFTTIYPGWYEGRTVHIHFKVRTPAASALAQKSAGSYEFTSQLFFDDALSDQVFAQPPYASKGNRGMRNADDGIYREAGSQLVLVVAPSSAGYESAFELGLDLSDAKVGAPDNMGLPPGGGRPPRGGPPPGRRPS